MQGVGADQYTPTLREIEYRGAQTSEGASDTTVAKGLNDQYPRGAGLGEVDADKAGDGDQTGKKRKATSEGDGKQKKTRQSQSCDACRARKVRCDRPPPGNTVDPSIPTKDVCSHCAHLGLECTFQYKPRKRGPPNQYLRKMQESEPPRSDQAGSRGRTDSATTPGWSPSEPHRSGRTSPVRGSSTMSAMNQTRTHGWDANLLVGRHSETSTDQSSAGLSTSFGGSSGFTPSIRVPDSHTNSHSQSPMYGRAFDYPSSSSHHLSRLSPNVAISPVNSSVSPFAMYPHNPQNPFDQVLPRGLLYLIIDLYFDYIYGLCPFVHRPSFMRDLHNRKEERSDGEEWTALMMAIIASTLVQIPRAFVPLPRSEVKALVSTTHAHVEAFLAKPYAEVTVTRLILTYISGLVTWMMGSRLHSLEYVGRAWALIVMDRCNEEATYATWNPVERELRRRIFWLIVGGSKSKAVLTNQCPISAEFYCADVQLPSLIEDEYFSEEGQMPQPDDKTSVLSGFYYVSKLFRLTGQMLDKQATDRVNPPTGIVLQMRIVEINGLYNEVMRLMVDCPPELRLDDCNDMPSVRSMPEDWGSLASRQIEELFTDPKASRKVVKDGFLVQQANIYVTQQMTRYLLLQYRDDLLLLQQNELAAQSEGGQGQGNGGSAPRRFDKSRAMFSDAEKEQVAGDLLVILQKIPIVVIAVNNLSLVAKVRFVASTLLDALGTSSRAPSPLHGDFEIDSEPSMRVQKAQNYLWEFLRILSEIEALYSMDDSGEASVI